MGEGGKKVINFRFERIVEISLVTRSTSKFSFCLAYIKIQVKRMDRDSRREWKKDAWFVTEFRRVPSLLESIVQLCLSDSKIMFIKEHGDRILRRDYAEIMRNICPRSSWLLAHFLTTSCIIGYRSGYVLAIDPTTGWPVQYLGIALDSPSLSPRPNPDWPVRSSCRRRTRETGADSRCSAVYVSYLGIAKAEKHLKRHNIHVARRPGLLFKRVLI